MKVRIRRFVEWIISVIAFCTLLSLLIVGIAYLVMVVVCWINDWPVVLNVKKLIGAFLLSFSLWLAVACVLSPNLEE